MAKIKVGISGWTYDDWKGVFYPDKLPLKKQLNYASNALSSIEVNGTFYRLQKAKSFTNWHDETPQDFCFSVKASQYITHKLRAKAADQAVANFFSSGLLALDKKLEVFLWQFPPYTKLKDDRFEKFFEKLPKNLGELKKVAENHDDFMKDRFFLDCKTQDHPIRHAFEFRHPSFKDSAFLDLMREHNMGWVIAHATKHDTFLEEQTADFVYYRMHAQDPKYDKGYPKKELQGLAQKVQSFAKNGTDVYMYFDNDAKAMAPLNALTISEILGINKLSADSA